MPCSWTTLRTNPFRIAGGLSRRRVRHARPGLCRPAGKRFRRTAMTFLMGVQYEDSNGQTLGELGPRRVEPTRQRYVWTASTRSNSPVIPTHAFKKVHGAAWTISPQPAGRRHRPLPGRRQTSHLDRQSLSPRRRIRHDRQPWHSRRRLRARNRYYKGGRRLALSTAQRNTLIKADILNHG